VERIDRDESAPNVGASADGNVSIAAFISAHYETIFDEWTSAIRSVVPESRKLNRDELRDHLTLVLKTVSKSAKPPGETQRNIHALIQEMPLPERGARAAQAHATVRHEEGFAIDQIVTEYRLMRATVLRLWAASVTAISPDDFEAVTRFNQAIDQAIAESVARFSERVLKTQNLMLAVLGHDLRTPLSTIAASAEVVRRTDERSRRLTAASRILRSSARIRALVNDLLDYAVTQLRGPMPVSRDRIDFEDVAKTIIDEVRAAHPECEIVLSVNGNAVGYWDKGRLAQLLSNLLENAVRHSGPNAPVTVVVRGEAEGVRLAVLNSGPPIPPDRLANLFEPMHEVLAERDDEPASSRHFSLGLYIVRQIVEAHEGRIDVTSTAAMGTLVHVWLPRRQ
jgi:signal transduction histidine kinase